ncbi:MAG: hypothetical protein IMW98_01980 [Firmicutes bacterium]|nr:hypothetical protein [Bacillota bacterium]
MSAAARYCALAGGGRWLDVEGAPAEIARALEAEGFATSLPDLIRRRLEEPFRRPRVTALGDAVFFAFWWPLAGVPDPARVLRTTVPPAFEVRRAPFGLLLAPGWLVTIHPGAAPPVQEIMASAGARADGVDGAVYALLERAVGDFERLALDLAQVAEEAAAALRRGTRDKFYFDLLDVRREALRLRVALGPARAVVELLRARDFRLVEDRWRPYFDDLAERVRQLVDDVEDTRLALRETLESHVSIHNERQNNFMQVLTVISTFTLPTTLVASIYGMNFRMPEYQWPHGYIYALGLMLALNMALFAYLWWRGWFR